jgi:hypothetical protein
MVVLIYTLQNNFHFSPSKFMLTLQLVQMVAAQIRRMKERKNKTEASKNWMKR